MKNLSLLFIAFLFLQLTLIAQQGWFQQTSGITVDLNSVYFVDEDNGWAVGDGGTILNTTNGGNTWNVQLSPIADDFRTVQFVDLFNGWITDWSTYTLLRTTDGGQNWADIGDTLYTICVYFIDENTGWRGASLSSEPACIFKSTDGGINWNEQFCVANNHSSIYRIQFVDSNFGWASFSVFPGGGGALRTTDGGLTWNNVNVGGNILYVDSLNGWEVGCSYDPEPGTEINYTSDGGYSWQQQFYQYGGNCVSSISLVNINTGWAAGRNNINYGFILHTSNSGNDWTEQDCGNVSPITSIHFVDNNTGWAVGEGGTILKTTTGGVVSVEEEQVAGVPTEYALTQNFPNPFNPSTKIKYTIPQSSNVLIKVFDILGNEIETLVNEQKAVGTYEITWYAENLPSGIYFYKLQSGNFIVSKKMILLK